MNFDENLKSYMSANDEGQMLLALGSIRHDEIWEVTMWGKFLSYRKPVLAA